MKKARFQTIAGATVRPDTHNLPHLTNLLESLRRYERPLQHPENSGNALKQFVDSEEYSRIIAGGLQSLHQGFQILPSCAGRGLLLIYRDPDFQIYIQRLPATEVDPDVMIMSAGSALLSVVSHEGSLDIERYRLQQDVDLSQFNNACRPVLHDTTRLTRNSHCFSCESGDILNITSSTGVSVIKVVENYSSPFHWTFDAKTLAPLFICAALPALSRPETLLDLALALEGDGRSMEDLSAVIQSAAKHPLHFVRWKAAQCLGRVDPTSALSVLQDFSANDPHPHVRASAKATLATALSR